MNCMNCGAFLTDRDLDYCPNCGYNVLIQKKVDYLSKVFYNQGLEKASIRDLSGAIACLLSKYPFLTNTEVKLKLHTSCVQIPGTESGWGILDFSRLLG